MDELREDICGICGEKKKCVVFFVEDTYYNIVICKSCVFKLLETFWKENH